MNMKVCILEANEVPLKVWKRYAAQFPDSVIARLLEQGKLYQTVADDVEEQFLYPSQTWASLNTGLSYHDHGVHWYNDPKENLHHFWWHQAAAAGKRVGLVNVLHTSPLQHLLNEAEYAFVLPDCFASDNDTHPSCYRDFQRMNLQLSRQNGRAVSITRSDITRIAGQALANPSGYGLNAFTVVESARALPMALRSRERLRNLQFLPLGSIFLDQMHAHDPDIGILFTNHIAAAQHRYWYALFPEDYLEPLYDAAWVKRYRTEILDAVGLFDRFLKHVARYCKATGRTLIIVSSMGQRANLDLQKKDVRMADDFCCVRDPVMFMEAIAGTYAGRFESAMVPQYTYRFNTSTELESTRAAIASFFEGNGALADSRIDINGNKLTLTLAFNCIPEYFKVGARHLSLDRLGMEVLHVDDHHSGCHSPYGTLLIWNDDSSKLFADCRAHETISYLRYAGEMRERFKLEAIPTAYHHGYASACSVGGWSRTSSLH